MRRGVFLGEVGDAPVHPDIHVRRAPFAASVLRIAEIRPKY